MTSALHKFEEPHAPRHALVGSLGRRRDDNPVVQILEVDPLCEAIDREGRTSES